MENITKHMYQDGNDLVVVYTNVFNSGTGLEDLIKKELLGDSSNIADLLEPVATTTPKLKKRIIFGYIPSEKWHRFLELGGKSEKNDGKVTNFAESEEIAEAIEKELEVERIK